MRSTKVSETEQLKGKVLDENGNNVIVEDVDVVIIKSTDVLDPLTGLTGLKRWGGHLMLPSSVASELLLYRLLQTGGKYKLVLDDDRSGAILVTSPGNRSADFTGTGPLE